MRKSTLTTLILLLLYVPATAFSAQGNGGAPTAEEQSSKPAQEPGPCDELKDQAKKATAALASAQDHYEDSLNDWNDECGPDSDTQCTFCNWTPEICANAAKAVGSADEALQAACQNAKDKLKDFLICDGLTEAQAEISVNDYC